MAKIPKMIFHYIIFLLSSINFIYSSNMYWVPTMIRYFSRHWGYNDVQQQI